ncbi:hypothetical protein LTR84_012981 [Exophiala bonariae]|uniref:Uncharacterized protein n=1 Tax=Exophiala bonariae TaxID=1690606 RepID=A0AAV9NH07_9EURO|nr:hypothetical protein LTR84_012981 [Exophiala bonariae]
MASHADQEVSSELGRAPAPETLTLLFKCHKSTTLLSVQPTRPFADIKVLLLGALQARGLNTLPGSTLSLPENADDLEFGVLADKKDASKGWVSLKVKEKVLIGSRGGKKKVGGNNSVINESPLAASLTDGSWVAYRLKAASKEMQGDEEDLFDGTPEVEMEDDGEWDVVLPSFDDEDAE